MKKPLTLVLAQRLPNVTRLTKKLFEIIRNINCVKNVTRDLDTYITSELQSIRDKLIKIADDYQNTAHDLRRFKGDHNLDREARYPESSLLHWITIGLIVIGESILNSYFLAMGNEFGLLGGFMPSLLSVLSM